MKLRLPLGLLSAVLATFAVFSTTTSSTMAAGEIISLNFAHDSNDAIDDGVLYGAKDLKVLGSAWNKGGVSVATQETPLALLDQNGAATGISASWSSHNTWHGGGDTNKMLNGYLDDGGGAPQTINLNLSGINFFTYDLIVFASTDNLAHTFSNKVVNGISYTAGTGEGNAVLGTAGWSTAEDRTTAGGKETANVNYIRIANVNAIDVLLKSERTGGTSTNYRGGISGIQIVNTYAGTAYKATLGSSASWTATNLGAAAWADSTAEAGTYAEIIADATMTTLSIEGNRITDGLVVSSGNLTLDGGTLELIGPGIMRIMQAGSTITFGTTKIVSGKTNLDGRGKFIIAGNQNLGVLIAKSAIEIKSGATLTLGGTNNSQHAMAGVLTGTGTLDITNMTILNMTDWSNLWKDFGGTVNVQAGSIINFGAIDLSTMARPANLTLSGDGKVRTNLTVSAGGSFNMAQYLGGLSTTSDSTFNWNGGSGEITFTGQSFNAFNIGANSVVTIKGSVTATQPVADNLGAQMHLVNGGQTVNIDSGAGNTFSVNKIRTHEGTPAGDTVSALNILSGTTVVTGKDVDVKNSAISLGHWDTKRPGEGEVKKLAASILDVKGGILNVLNGSVQVGCDNSKNEFRVTGTGVANVRRIAFAGTAESILTLDGGALHVGAGGIVATGGVNDEGVALSPKIMLSSGSLGTYVDTLNISANILLKGAGAVTINSTKYDVTAGADTALGSEVTLGGIISSAEGDAGGLTIAGKGTVKLTGANTFTGGVTLQSGTLKIDSMGNLGASKSLTIGGESTIIIPSPVMDFGAEGKLVFKAAGNLNFGGDIIGLRMGVKGANLTLESGTTLSMDAATDNRDQVKVDGSLSLGAIGINFNLNYIGLSLNDTVTLLSTTGGHGITSWDAIKFNTVDPGDARGATYDWDKTNTKDIVLKVTGGGAGQLTWQGAADAVWGLKGDGSTGAWNNATGNDHQFYTGDNVIFGTLSGQAENTITVAAGGVSPALMTVQGDTAYTLTGGAISGKAAIIKKGDSIFTIANQNIYTGETRIEGGSILVKKGATIGSSIINLTTKESLISFEEHMVRNQVTGLGTASYALGTAEEIMARTFLLGSSADFTHTGNMSVSLDGWALKGDIKLLEQGKTTGTFTLSLQNLIVATTDTLAFTGANTHQAALISGTGIAGTLQLNFAGSSRIVFNNVTDGTYLFTGATQNLILEGINTVKEISLGKYEGTVLNSRVLNIAGTAEKKVELNTVRFRIQRGGAMNLENATVNVSSTALAGVQNSEVGIGSNDLPAEAMNILNLNAGATFNVIKGASLKMGSWKDGATLNINDGAVANIGGISIENVQEFAVDGKPRGNAIVLNAGGTLNLGNLGIISFNGEVTKKAVISLGAGNLGVIAEHSSAFIQGRTTNKAGVTDDAFVVTLSDDTTGVNINPAEGKTLTINASIQGDGRIVKTGAGTLVLNTSENTTDSSYKKALELKEGILKFANVGSLGESKTVSVTGQKGILSSFTDTAVVDFGADGKLSIASAGKLNFGGNGMGTKISLAGGNLTLAQGATFVMDAAKDNRDQLVVTGGLTLDHANFELNYIGLKKGDSITLITTTEGLTVSNWNEISFTQQGGSGDLRAITANWKQGEANNLVLDITGGGAETLNWVAGGGTWALKEGGANVWRPETTGLADLKFYTGDVVVFGQLSNTDESIVIGDAGVAPSAMTVTGTTNYTFSGGGIMGASSLLKQGTGILTLNNLNTYTGETTIEGGSIVVGTTGSFGTGTVNFKNNSQLVFLADDSINQLYLGAGTVTHHAGDLKDVSRAFALSANATYAHTANITAFVDGANVTGDFSLLESGNTTGIKTLNIVNTTITGKLKLVGGPQVFTLGANTFIRNIYTGGSGSANNGPNPSVTYTGDVTINVSGAVIGDGVVGFDADCFAFAPTGGVLAGNATLNISSGEIRNETLWFTGFGGKIVGDANINLSCSGSIESNIAPGGKWSNPHSSELAAAVNGNFNVILDGGTLGKELKNAEGALIERSLSTTTGEYQTIPTVLSGDVNYTFKGGNNGEGTTFRGLYSVLAGSTVGGQAVAGKSLITIQDITAQNADTKSGFANYTGIISGGNKTGAGEIKGTKSLVIDGYTAPQLQANLMFFDTAMIQGASNFTLTNALNKGIAKWTIAGNSNLHFASESVLGGATSVTIDAGSTWSIDGDYTQMVVTTLVNNGNINLAADKTWTMAASTTSLGGTINLGLGSTLTVSSDFSATGAGIVSTGGNFTLTNAAFTGNVALNGASTMSIATKTGAAYTGAIALEQGANLNITGAANGTMGFAFSGAGTINVNQAAGTSLTFNATTGSHAGALNVKTGTLVANTGTALAGSTITVEENAVLRTLFANLDAGAKAITGAGTLSIGVNSTVATSAHSISKLKLEDGKSLTATYGNGVGSLFAPTASLTLGKNSVYHAIYNGAGDFTLNDFANTTLAGGSATIRLESNSEGSVVYTLNGKSWTDSAEGRALVFNLTGTGFENSYIQVSDETLWGSSFAHVWLTKNDGGRESTEIDATGRLVAFTNGIELQNNTGLDIENATKSFTASGINGIVSLAYNTKIGCLRIKSSEANNRLNVGVGQLLSLTTGVLIKEGDAEFTINQGSIAGNAEKLDISVNSSKGNLIINSDVVEATAGNTSQLVKAGGGTLVLQGALNNKGGILITAGTLQLTGNAKGSADSGSIMVNAETSLLLGDGKNAFSLNYANNSITNEGTLEYLMGATADFTKIANNSGLVILNMAPTGAQTMNAAPAGEGTIRVVAGTLSNGMTQTQNIELAQNGTFKLLGSAGYASFTNAIKGAGNVIISTESEFTYGNAGNDYTGTTKIEKGNVVWDAASTTTGFGKGQIIIGNSFAETNANLMINGAWAANSTIANAFTLYNSKDSNGSLTISSENITLGGTITIGGSGSSIQSSANVNILGKVTGSGPLTLKTTTPTASITLKDGRNDFSGGLTISGLVKVGAQGTALGTGNVILSSQSSLDLNGTSLTSILSLRAAVNSVTSITNSRQDTVAELVMGRMGAIQDADNVIFATIQDGGTTGKVKITKTGSNTLTLSGSNNFTGGLDIQEGTVVYSLNEASVANVISVRNNAKLEFATIANIPARNANYTVNLYAGSSVKNVSEFGGHIIVSGGTDGAVSTVEGNLMANTLKVGSAKEKDSGARLNVKGDLSIANGGEFYLDGSNSNKSANPILVKSSGAISVAGTFNLIFDINSDYASGNMLSYTLFSGSNVTANANNFVLMLGEGNSHDFLKEFYNLTTTVRGTTITADILRSRMICHLIEQNDIVGTGAYVNGFISADSSNYLGAKQGAVVNFDKQYTISKGDTAYRLTNGEGWLNMLTQLTDQAGMGTRLLIADYANAQDPNGSRGVLLANNANNYTGGTEVLNSHVILDGSLGLKGISSGSIGLLGTGAVRLGGLGAILELRTGGVGSTVQFFVNNDITLLNGASIEQTSSKNTLRGNILINDYASIKNAQAGAQILGIEGAISGNQLTMIGAQGGIQNVISMTGTNSSGKITESKLNKLILKDALNLVLNGQTNLSTNTLDVGLDSTVSLKTGSELVVGIVAGSGALDMEGGTFKAMGNILFGGAGVRLHIKDVPYADGEALFADGTLSGVVGNNINTNGFKISLLDGLGAEDKNFTVTGGGILSVIKDSSAYDNTLTIADATVEIAKNVTFGTANSKIEVGKGGLLETGENAILNNKLEIFDGGNTKFGAGTQINGNSVISIYGGGTYSGFTRGDNLEINFKENSRFNVDVADIRTISSGAQRAMIDAKSVSLTSNGGNGFFFISGDEGSFDGIDFSKKITLIKTSDTLTLDGQGITVGSDLTNLMGKTDYMWLSFSLQAGASAKADSSTSNEILLGIDRNVDYNTIAQTENEHAVAPALSYLGGNYEKMSGEMKDLGKALGAVTTAEAYPALSKAADSISSVLSGYTAQIDQLRRHTLDIRDRAVQDKASELRFNNETTGTIWASGLGGSYSLANSRGNVGYTATTWGGTVGVTKTLSPNWMAGIAFTYSTTDLDLDGGLGKATSEATSIDAYARYSKDQWNVTAVVTGGTTDFSSTRNMSLPGYSSVTEGSSSGDQVNALVEVGYEIDLGTENASFIEPFVLASAGYSSLDGFSETGAGNAGLAVDSQSKTLATLGAGARYVTEFYTSRADVLKGRFEARIMVLQDLTDEDIDATSSFIGAPGEKMNVKSNTPGSTALAIGTGVVVPVSAKVSVFADLNGEFRTDQSSVNANVGVKYDF